jgi:hypothetical protein
MHWMVLHRPVELAAFIRPWPNGTSVVLPDRLQYRVLQWNTNSPVHTVEKKFRWCWTCPLAAKPTLKTARYAANQSKSALPSKMTNSPASLLRPSANASRNRPYEVDLHFCGNNVNRTWQANKLKSLYLGRICRGRCRFESY